MTPAYVYNAIVLRVVDGDTLDCEVDLGFGVLRRERLRLLGIDAPDADARDALLALVAGRAPNDLERASCDLVMRRCDVVVRTVKDRSDARGVYLARVFAAGVDVNTAMLQAGHARQYAGTR